ncbi:Hypothetical protein CUL131002_1429c [Corynebacterium ulcerans]|nr:Hypothetical protein CUL131002_1429c [Corynebacterium ulcerans]
MFPAHKHGIISTVVCLFRGAAAFHVLGMNQSSALIVGEKPLGSSVF